MGSTIKTFMIFPPSFDVFSSGSDNENPAWGDLPEAGLSDSRK